MCNEIIGLVFPITDILNDTISSIGNVPVDDLTAAQLSAQHPNLYRVVEDTNGEDVLVSIMFAGQPVQFSASGVSGPYSGRGNGIVIGGHPNFRPVGKPA